MKSNNKQKTLDTHTKEDMTSYNTTKIDMEPIFDEVIREWMDSQTLNNKKKTIVEYEKKPMTSSYHLKIIWKNMKGLWRLWIRRK